MAEMIFSYSRLDSFQGKYGCPWKWYLRYILEISEPPTPALIMGKAAHAVLEQIAGPMRGMHPQPLIAGIAKTNDLSEEELTSLVTSPVVNEIRGRMFSPITEEYFCISLGEITLQGYIDLYAVSADQVYLVDWKTNQVSYKVLDTYQLALYAKYLTKKYQLPVEGNLVFLRLNKIETHQFTADEIQSAVDWANRTGADILERIELLDSMNPESLFPKCPGTACQYCGYAKICQTSVETPEIITTPEEAQKVAEKIVLLEAQSDQLKGILKSWVERFGPVPVNSKEFRIDETYWWKFPNGSLERAVGLMREQGIDPLKILRLTAEGLKQLPWSEDTLLSLGAQKQMSKRFVFASKK